MSTPGFSPVFVADLIGCVQSSSGTFQQLELLFKLIGEKAADPVTVQTLAEIGASLAFDGDNFAGSTHEQATKGGVRS